MVGAPCINQLGVEVMVFSPAAFVLTRVLNQYPTDKEPFILMFFNNPVSLWARALFSTSSPNDKHISLLSVCLDELVVFSDKSKLKNK